MRAPALEGLYGKPVPLSDGTIEIADERYHPRFHPASRARKIAAGYRAADAVL